MSIIRLIGLCGLVAFSQLIIAEMPGKADGVYCSMANISCRYILLDAGRVPISELMKRARLSVDTSNMSSRLDDKFGRIQKGINSSEVTFWSTKKAIRERMAKALIYHDTNITADRANDYHIEALAYAVRENSVKDIFLGIDGGYSNNNTLKNGLIENTAPALSASNLFGWIGIAGAALFKVRFKAAFKKGKAQRWVNGRDIKYNGGEFNFNSKATYYIDGVGKTQREESGFEIKGVFYESRKYPGIFNLEPGAKIFLGTKPGDEDLSSVEVDQSPTQQSSSSREGVTIVNRHIDGTRLIDGKPTIVFDSSEIIERNGGQYGTGNGSLKTSENLRLFVILTISKSETFQNNQTDVIDDIRSGFQDSELGPDSMMSEQPADGVTTQGKSSRSGQRLNQYDQPVVDR